MVDKTPAQITPGTANDDSVVHASDASLADLSRSHTERDISRLQGDAPLFQVTKTYIINDLVTQNDIVYRNIVAIPVAGAFDPTDWEPVATPNRFTVGSATDASTVFASSDDDATIPEKHIEREISRLQSAMLVYDAAKTYEIGDIVKEGAFFYRCIVQITVPEAFDDDNWEFIDNGLGVFLVSYDLDSPDDNEYFVMSGGSETGDPTEADATAPSPGTFTTFQYTLQVTANSRGIVTNWQIRSNGADTGSSVDVPAGLTGTFQDLTDFDNHVVGDLICYQYSEPGGGGGLTINGSSCGVRRTDL